MTWIISLLICVICVHPWQSQPIEKPRIVVYKSARKLELYSDKTLLRTYRVGLGCSPVADKQREASEPSRSTAVRPEVKPEPVPAPRTEKSYTGTPAKPEEGRTAADAKAAEPASEAPAKPARRPRQRKAKPPGSETPPEPGVPPTERK